MTPQLAEYFGLSKRSGALVVFVFADSPAAKAGLKAGDVILSMAGETVENPMDVRRILSTKSEGSIELKVLRDKQEQTISVHVEKGTTSWLLEPEDSDEVVAVSTPVIVNMPKIHVHPAAVSLPKIQVTPVVVSVPMIKLAPMKIESPMVPVIPSSMKIEIPKIDMAPMKIQIPKIDMSPVKILVWPGRVIV
jgi:membrane-associated protease RseP (regulator of RpoE activity)